MTTRLATPSEARSWEAQYQKALAASGNGFGAWPQGTVFRGSRQFGHSPALRTAAASPRLVFSFLTMASSGSVAANGKTTISGCAVPFEKPSNSVPGAVPELIKRGAFRKSLSLQRDQRVTFNFQTAFVVGRTKSGTARVWEDESGLQFEAFPPPGAAWADGLLISVDRGDITGAAAAYIPRIHQRTSKALEIHEADLIMVAITGFPEFDGGSLTVTKSESAAASKTSARDRRFLAEMGIQASAAQLGGRVHF